MVKQRAVVMMFTRITVAVAVVVLLFAAMSGGPALAGKPAGKGGGKPSPAPTVTMAVSPSPVPGWGAVYTISGTGFTPGAAVNFVKDGVAKFAVADANGFATSIWTSWTPGTYTAYAKQFSGKSYVQVGSITFNVVQT